MTNNKKLGIVGAVAAIAGTGIISATSFAATPTGSGYSPLVQKIANKFNLKPADVQKVVDQNRADRKNGRQARVKTWLDAKVSDGTITQVQEDKLIAKLKELRQTRSADRKQGKQEFRTQIQQWLTDNGINVNIDQLLPNRPPQ